MHVLALGAHPDDPEIGCGGSLALHAEAGDRVTVLYATAGGAVASSAPEDETAARRRAEAEEACAILGAPAPIFLGFSDGLLPYAGYPLVAAIGRVVRGERPDIVYVHHTGDAHPDHAALAAAAVDAVRRAGTPHFPDLGDRPHQVREIRLYEVWTPLAEPSTATDITGVAEKKAEAIRCHASQARVHAYDEIAMGLNRYRSLLLPGSRYAEAFGAARPRW
jgi:LmbE family N-acetylglucosaminyl deacetylase